MKKILILLALLTISACSKSDDNGPFSDDDLTGTYRACAPDDGTVLGTGSQDIELKFSDNTFTVKTTYFSNTDCTGTTLGDDTSDGTFVTSGNTINYSYSSGVTIYDIYEVNGVNLKVGERDGANNGSSEALRPTTYETEYEFSKL